jgi:hypothetical protein
MALTGKQEAFAQGMANGATQTSAYRKAYGCEKMLPATIQNNAYKLTIRNDIKTRIAELQSALTSKSLWTREKSVLALAMIADNGEGRSSDIVAAIKELNAMHGFNAPTKQELTHTFPRAIHVVAGRI